MKLRLLTVDDEKLAQRRLRVLLRAMPNIDHVGEAGGMVDALDKFAVLRPNALLLDIKMRDGSGFDVAESLASERDPPAIIFVTAFSEFAVRAFEYNAIDFLLKPIDRSRFAQSLERARRWLRLTDADERAEELQHVVRSLRSAKSEDLGKNFETEFWVRSLTGLVLVSVDSIECVSSEEDYVAIHTASGSYLMRTSIRQFMDRVEPGLFVRVHRSWLVKKTAISELRGRKFSPNAVILRSGRHLPAGRIYLKHLRRDVQLGHLYHSRNMQRMQWDGADRL